MKFPISFYDEITVVLFEFLGTNGTGKEGSGLINVTVTRNASTALPISLTITPTEYNNASFVNDSNSIAKRKQS